MRIFARLIVAFLLTIMVLPVAVQAQEDDLDASERSRLVALIQQHLRSTYVYEDVGIAMGDLVQMRLGTGDYDDITNPDQFAHVLTEDLRSVSHDLHLAVVYRPPGSDSSRPGGWVPPSTSSYGNYTFVAVERLRGNVGYIQFDAFVTPAPPAAKVAESAMAFISHTDALIFDMRYNTGGTPEMVQFITSYLFDATPVHLNSLYDRARDLTHEYWTLENIEGHRMPDVPVFVLTSSQTVSGAEEFTYNLQALDRATIVGEVTRGGAHPTKGIDLGDGYMIQVPFARAINPITGTNWEGIGIIPDVEVDQADALSTAHLLALDVLIEAAGETSQGSYLRWEREALAAEYDPVTVDDSVLERYAGTYQSDVTGTWELRVAEDGLMIEHVVFGTTSLQPISETVFMVTDRMRLEIHVDDDGAVTHLTFFDAISDFDTAVYVP